MTTTPPIHPRNERVLLRLVEPGNPTIIAPGTDSPVSADGYLEIVEAAPNCKQGPWPKGSRVLVTPGANVFHPKGLPSYGLLHETSIMAIDDRGKEEPQNQN